MDETVATTSAKKPLPKTATKTANSDATVASTVAVTKFPVTKTVATKPTVKATPKPVSKPATPKTSDATVASTVVTKPVTKTAPKPVVKTNDVTVAAKTSVRTSTKTVSTKTEREPKKIGKYIKEKKLAQGGMGAVYIASDPDLGNKVILKKLILKNNAAAEERFMREATILRELQNPHIVNTFEYFKQGRSSYLVEELIEGCSLDKLIEKYKEFKTNDIKDDPNSSWAKTGPLGTELALLVFLDACYGLRFAHLKKIVHRDIKPGNLLISKDAEVKLTDFGIASDDKAEQSESENSDDDDDEQLESDGLTVAGSMLGTPSYMSPEQVTDSSSVDARADIYSMGVMLYEMLTGEKPFGCPIRYDEELKTYVPDETVEKMIKKGKYINPRKFNPSIPLNICSMIKKMLKYDAKKRYESMKPIIKIIEKYLSKFDKAKIRGELAIMVRGLSDDKKHRVKILEGKKPIVQIAVASILGAFLLIFGSISLWKNGFVHKTILSPWYSAVNLKMQIPNKGVDNVYSTNLPMMAFFFEDEGEQDEVKNSSRSFEKVIDKKSKTNQDVQDDKKVEQKYEDFFTKPVYLQKGRYRIKVVFGSYIIWRSVNVGKDDVDVVIDDLLSMKDRRITISPKSFDLKTGADLTSKTKFTLNYKGEWTALSKVPAKDIVSGRAWKVRANCDGYSTKEFSMLVDWYQDNIILNVGLE